MRSRPECMEYQSKTTAHMIAAICWRRLRSLTCQHINTHARLCSKKKRAFYKFGHSQIGWNGLAKINEQFQFALAQGLTLWVIGAEASTDFYDISNCRFAATQYGHIGSTEICIIAICLGCWRHSHIVFSCSSKNNFDVRQPLSHTF